MDVTGVWAVVVAGGAGARFGGAKQFADLGGRPVLAWSVRAAATRAEGVVAVVPRPDAVPASLLDPRVIVVAGGSTRSASVRKGLAAVPEDAEIVVVHDAVRPLAAPALFSAVIQAVRAGAEGAVPGLAVTDTLKRVAGDVVIETVERSDLVAVQTPQAFRASALRRAHAGGADAGDDAALVEAIGGRVVVVPGQPQNVKITEPADLDLVAWWASR